MAIKYEEQNMKHEKLFSEILKLNFMEPVTKKYESPSSVRVQVEFTYRYQSTIPDDMLQTLNLNRDCGREMKTKSRLV